MVSQIHPITGAVIGATPAAQQMQSADKAAQLRRLAARRAGKTAANRDTFEPQIETAHALDPIGDEHHQNRRQNRHPPRKSPAPSSDPTSDDGGSTLDVTA
jgi:hypothetical protein